MPTFIKDLIDLPDQVRRGDFVLRLTEGVTKPEETVASYVVTPQLVHSFDDALGLIRSGIEGAPARQHICMAALEVAKATSWPCFIYSSTTTLMFDRFLNWPR